MKELDLDAYDWIVFTAIIKLIHERNPTLDEEAIKNEALDLMEQHVRAVSVLSLRDPNQPAWDRGELEQLHIHAAGIARVLRDLSFESEIELKLFFGSKRPPDLKRLHQDTKTLSDSLRDGLKKRPPAAKGRPKDIGLAILIEEAVTVFRKASGIDPANLPNPRSQKSRDKKHKLYQFVRVLVPKSIKYGSDEQFGALKDRVDEHLADCKEHQ
jgi:hypothetical protein